jgi:hypothetical protein
MSIHICWHYFNVCTLYTVQYKPLRACLVQHTARIELVLLDYLISVDWAEFSARGREDIQSYHSKDFAANVCLFGNKVRGAKQY